jgi:hypothetical protein
MGEILGIGLTPRRCMEVGARLAETLLDGPWRIALIASSSWSHAFLTARSGYLWLDLECDREHARGDRGLEAMNSARLAAEAAERAGSHPAVAMAYLFPCIAGVPDEQWDAAIA